MKYSIIVLLRSDISCAEALFSSLTNQSVPTAEIELLLANTLGDAAASLAERWRSRFGCLTLRTASPSCPADALNRLAIQAAAPQLIFLQDCAVLDPGCLARLSAFCQRMQPAVGVALCKSPMQDGYHFDPVTLDCPYISFDAAMVSKDAFLQARGFDSAFSVCRDIDLSWRLRLAGKLLYCPDAVVSLPPVSQTMEQYVGAACERLLLAHKYCPAQLSAQRRAFWQAVKTPQHFPGVRKALVKAWLRHLLQLSRVCLFPKRKEILQAGICDFQPNFAPQRGQQAFAPLHSHPLVSIVVRTHKRKDVLRRTLQSLRNQAYDNFEVVVVEDGENTAQAMLEQEFSDLPIRYFSTGTPVGRGRAGNIGIEQAKGEYVSFLDDDDFYYPDYITSHLAEFEKDPAVGLVFSTIMAQKVNVKTHSPYVFTTHGEEPVLFDRISLMDMCVRCRVPISGGMFKRSLYAECGGMREDIDGDEDWAMWLRFLSKTKRADRFAVDIRRTVSLCIFPADQSQEQQRTLRYQAFDKVMLSDPQLVFNVSGEEIQAWEKSVAGDIAHLRAIGQLDAFLQQLHPLGVQKLEYLADGMNTLTAWQINNYYYYLVEQNLQK